MNSKLSSVCACDLLKSSGLQWQKETQFILYRSAHWPSYLAKIYLQKWSTTSFIQWKLKKKRCRKCSRNNHIFKKLKHKKYILAELVLILFHYTKIATLQLPWYLLFSGRQAFRGHVWISDISQPATPLMMHFKNILTLPVFTRTWLPRWNVLCIQILNTGKVRARLMNTFISSLPSACSIGKQTDE